ncbi:hypothetical protein FKP32DRAFT_524227 [Trametes sanguinea]|nr:hypothetical protein FKP32DRAFT_524227 [Trametes sanguinea]
MGMTWTGREFSNSMKTSITGRCFPRTPGLRGTGNGPCICLELYGFPFAPQKDSDLGGTAAIAMVATCHTREDQVALIMTDLLLTLSNMWWLHDSTFQGSILWRRTLGVHALVSRSYNMLVDRVRQTAFLQAYCRFTTLRWEGHTTPPWTGPRRQSQRGAWRPILAPRGCFLRRRDTQHYYNGTTVSRTDE